MKSDNVLVRGASAFLIALLVAGQTGCAAYYAGKMPGPVADERVGQGMKHSEVETLIGDGPSSQFQDGDVTVVR